MNRIYKELKPIIISIVFFSMVCCAGENGKYNYPKLDVRISNLRHSVKYLTDIRPYRNYRNTQSLDKTATYIADKLAKYGLSTEIQKFEVKGKEYKNVIAKHGKEKKKRIIVGAHYDVCGNQPGADDNASAVAGLLEIARLTAENISETQYGFDFIAYSLEEPPFFNSDQMGSYVHAKSVHDKGVNIRGMICLEMIGFFTTEEKSQEYPLDIMKLSYPSVGNFIAVVGNMGSSDLTDEVAVHLKATSLGVETLKAPALLAGVDFSDHRNYWHFGYQAVMITDTAFYRNPNYHEISDTPDTLDFEKMSEVVKGITWALINMK